MTKASRTSRGNAFLLFFKNNDKISQHGCALNSSELKEVIKYSSSLFFLSFFFFFKLYIFFYFFFPLPERTTKQRLQSKEHIFVHFLPFLASYLRFRSPLIFVYEVGQGDRKKIIIITIMKTKTFRDRAFLLKELAFPG